MRINKSFPKQAASALLVSLFMITLLALSVAGYLTYVEQQALLGARSQAWNLALGLSEAGVEEALQHLNVNYANLHTDEWSVDGPRYTSPLRTLTNGSYTVTIDNSFPHVPVITSRAYVIPPTFARNAPTAMFAQIGADQPTTAVNRAVRVTASRGSLFLASMVAKHGIDLKGNGITSDSFDSADPAKSTNGRWDPAKALDKGDIASNDGIFSTVSVGNANIYGHVYTGPGGTATIGSLGAVGTHEWQAAGNTGFQPGYVLDTANFTFPDTTMPYSSGLPPTGGYVVTISSISTNSTTYTTATPPSAPVSGYMGPVTTNTTTVTTSVYPSPTPAGLTTNTSNTTVATLPSPVPAGTSTNYTTASTSSRRAP